MSLIRYTGLQPRPETPITGTGLVWFPGESRQVEDATRARQLLLAGMGWEFLKDSDVAGPFSASKVASMDALVSGARIAPTSSQFIIIAGDSIAEGSLNTFPQDDGRGWWSTANDTNNGGNLFIRDAASTDLASSEAYSIVWDGAAFVNAGGASVDITGGGFFTLLDAGGKRIYIFVRWANRTTSQTINRTAAGSRTKAMASQAGIFAGALARVGALGSNRAQVKNYAHGGEKTSDLIARFGQIETIRPWALLICVGYNGIASAAETALIPELVRRAAACAMNVVLAVPPPAGTFTAATAGEYRRVCKAFQDEGAKYPNVLIGDAARVGHSGFATSGTTAIVAGLYNGSDNVHPHVGGVFGRWADCFEPLLRDIGVASSQPALAGIDAYDATNNVLGNLLVARAYLTGTTGTKGATPVPGGNVPTSWTDLADGSSGAFTTVTVTPADDGAAQLRPDSGGRFATVQCATASGGTAGRYLKCAITAGGLDLARLYRVGATIRIRDASLVTRLQLFLSTNTGAVNALTSIPGTQMGASYTLLDSGVLYLASEPTKLPAGTSSAELFLWVQCAVGGSITVDIADPFLTPV